MILIFRNMIQENLKLLELAQQWFLKTLILLKLEMIGEHIYESCMLTFSGRHFWVCNMT